MANEQDVRGQFKALDKTLPFDGPDAIDSDCLECFEYEYADKAVGEDVEIEIATEEFTSVCPFSGLPDFGRVKVTYIPDKHCIELRSYKYYLLSYRNVGIFYEHLINRLLNDLVKASAPKRMKIEIVCSLRGGVSSTLTQTYNWKSASASTDVS